MPAGDFQLGRSVHRNDLTVDDERDSVAQFIGIPLEYLPTRMSASSARPTAASNSIGSSSRRQRLTQMRDFYNFLLEEIPAVLDRWHQRG